ncbi:phage tail protein [Enterobacter asburiae]|uniref:tail fiber/spike domain-containing protein n=1 Tax=Enterobacter asburiae TaxID=61645 RepID=UPI002005F7BE|nr:phage tail protein [Enterobacter asburiae]MCK6991618.1 phage tail protein [Enterobacter asburiae]
MTTYNTGNPIGSYDPRDLYDNSQNLDQAANDTSNETWKDRLGKSRRTWQGLEVMVSSSAAAFGYITLVGVNFTTGATVNINELLLNPTDNSYYKWTGAFPTGGKVVPPNSSPNTTGGQGPGKWLNVGDSSLRSDLANGGKASLVGYEDGTVKDAIDLLNENKDALSANTGFDKVGRFLNISALRSQVPSSVDQIVYIASAASATSTEKHYGGGYFQSFDNSTSQTVDDGGIVIVPTAGTLAWRRINFTAYDMQFWGVKADGVTDNAAAITRATDYARAHRIILEAPAGNIRTSKMVPIYDNMGIRGFGKAESTVFVKTTNDKFDYMNGATIALQVDALAGFVPKKWDIPDYTMESFCVHGRLENCLFRRESTSVTSEYGLFLGKAASPVVRQCNFEGGRTGIKTFNCFSGVMEMVAAVTVSGTGFIGVDFSDVRGGVMYMTGTSMDLRCVQVRGYQFGFNIYRLQYSTMVNCTAEDINPMSGETISYAFNFYDPYCISMNACATEFVKGGQVRIQGYANPSYRPAIKITNYLAIDQINPVVPTPIYIVDNGSITPMNVVIEASELGRVTSNTNLTAPTVSGNGAKVIIIGCDGEDWLASGSGVFTRLA